MEKIPQGGLIGKTVHLWRRVSKLRVPVYAANASFFLVLAVFPGLLLLLGLLRYTPLEVERLGELLVSFLPEALVETAEELILLTYDNTSGITLGLSVVTTLWSAGRGIYGIIAGLNAVYEVEETRGYLQIRLLGVIYTFLFFLALLLALGLYMLGWKLLPVFQTGVFTVLYMVLPNGRNRFGDSLPGALLASSGWLVFSDLYSVYVEHFAPLSSVYGSVYAVALSLLWLYFCMAILFYGGALNKLLTEG